MVLGFLKSLAGRILGGEARAEAREEALAASKEAVGRSMATTAMTWYRNMMYESIQESLYQPEGVRSHAAYTQTWESLPTNYMSIYKTDIWNDEIGDYESRYVSLLHDDLLSEDEESDLISETLEESFGEGVSVRSIEFVGGKTSLPEFISLEEEW